MAKSEKKPEATEGGKPKKKHLHQIVTEKAHDGSFTHHHVYKDKPEDHFSHPARLMATSSTPEEAGDHVAEQFGASQGQPDQHEPQDEAAAGQGGAPPDQEAAPAQA